MLMVAACERSRIDESDGGNGGYTFRKAASRKDPGSTALLAQLCKQWTAEDIDTAIDTSGKSALHHAAWKGHIDNVRILCDVGADPNLWSVGEFSYGKSAIFFAITQCRDDVVLLLLARGASPRIVNNKGQSVLSLAISHLRPDTVASITAAEERSTADWLNFRETHSDGRTYGDQDIRFLERPLQLEGPNPDVLEGKCVNPTTKLSRRDSDWAGSRQKRAELKAISAKGPRRRKAKLGAADGEAAAADGEAAAAVATDAWARVSAALDDGDADALAVSLASLIDTVYDSSHSVHRKTDWIPAASQRLQELATAVDKVSIIQKMFASSANPSAEQLTRQQLRQLRMYRRLLSLAAGAAPGCTIQHSKAHCLNTSAIPKTKATKRQPRSALDKSVLRQPSRPLAPLRLSLEPVWVDTVEGLLALKTELQMLVGQQKENDREQRCFKHCSRPLLGFDTEWCNGMTDVSSNSPTATTVVATIALAFATVACEGPRGDALGPHRCWVIDARPIRNDAYVQPLVRRDPSLHGTADSDSEHVVAAGADAEQAVTADTKYRGTLAQLLLWLWKESGTVPVGFAVKNDVKMLEQIDPELLRPIRDFEMMDVQQLAIQAIGDVEGAEAVVELWSRQLPGLAACSAHFLGGGLDKSEQRSEWADRPLRLEQLMYAAMDAVVLLELVSAFDKNLQINLPN